MDNSTQLVVAVGLVTLLVSAAMRYGTSNALEALGLISLRLGLQILRAGLRTLRAVLKLVLWLMQR